ncbi:hypothetical protein DXG03_007013 [Asterophora parasitica]|uniref:UBC core domain-containing protein n=1 Tax=Asterophora parasitica TaxID=117018 RepID=A0A9P7GCG9_9AGAR|nr:hypothetical protein DXG03_007013 [Asterophora parasitica]
MADKNAHLKGRRRYKADLADMKEECAAGVVTVQGYTINELVEPEEGSIEFAICGVGGQHILSLTLLMPDTSDYPKSHMFFGSSHDSGLSPRLADVVQGVASDIARPIRQTIQDILIAVATTNKDTGFAPPDSSPQEAEFDDDDSSTGAYDSEAFDQFDELDHSITTKLNFQTLQNNFVETVAAGYRPGLLHFADDDFAISVSIPVITLARSIPPRALMAWDRRLLSRSQHFTLLISGFRGVYPPHESSGAYNPRSALKFNVGLTKKYKPGKEYAKNEGRTFGLIVPDGDEIQFEAEKEDVEAYDYEDYAQAPAPAVEEAQVKDDGSFDRFSLSSSLENLLDQALLKVIQLRRQFGLGWAGAELLLSEMEKTQTSEDIVFHTNNELILAADREEVLLGRTNDLPHDPLSGLGVQDEVNITLTAFSYLLRRLSLCPRYCIVCHNRLNTDYEALKPYICIVFPFDRMSDHYVDKYEIIHNPETVDLLVSVAHSAAAEQVIEDPLPIGMGIRVPFPKGELPPEEVTVGPDGLCDFDDLSLEMMRACIVELINSLPSVEDMKKHLERKVKAGKAKPRLKDLDLNVLPAAWSILRWCVASCTAHLEEITYDPGWRQFRFSVGSPDAEAKFQAAVNEAQKKNPNARIYPSLYAFHGSALKNWHSIIRHGLWYKSIVNGRAYGHGVYLAKEGSVSMGVYAQAGRTSWRRSKISPTNCVALAEIVNLPQEFVSQNPHFVVKDTHWIICRYLLVKGAVDFELEPAPLASSAYAQTPLVKLDPTQPITLSNKRIEVPEPSYRISALLQAMNQEYREEENDDEDNAVFQADYFVRDAAGNEEFDMDVDEDYMVDYDDRDFGAKHSTSWEKAKVTNMIPPVGGWKHDAEWVAKSVENLMPPPLEASPSATMAVQRELKSMLKEQESARSLKELGWYMPPDLIGDNLFRWIVEMHSFDECLPIAKDMKAKSLNSLIFEIRFPPTFPISPPFFRIVTPRFLPFIQGGGGHVTGGGSICMDLLTSDGWLPSYSIPAVLMQIKLAISNLDPKPARLAADFHRPYGAEEALIGYKRAAATHGWKVPKDTDRLVR